MTSTSSAQESVYIVCGQCNTRNRIPTRRLTGEGRCGRCKAPLFEGKVIELDHENIASQLKTEIPLLIDFWAPWCGPCQQFSPIFEQAAQVFEPFIRCAKVNTEQEQQLSSQFRIRSIPTLILILGSQEIARTSGVMKLHQLQRWVKSHLQS